MDTNEPGVLYFSEKFEFAATHKLWNDRLSEPQNVKIFGKCANPTGHGHNYLVEVTVKTPAEGPALEIGQFEHIVDSQLMQLVDHKNLNLDVAAFREKVPTVENIAIFAWEHLAGKFGSAQLHCVTVWESDRTYCTYCGPGESRRMGFSPCCSGLKDVMRWAKPTLQFARGEAGSHECRRTSHGVTTTRRRGRNRTAG
jgi:6-pyruvoyltetrahydropterin/6-carboxytetrahydropterin synthase